jgi:CRP-like cAMP-binding protein
VDTLNIRTADLEIFSDCSKAELRQIESMTTLVHVPKGRVLIEEGAPAREFFIIGSGEARITRKSSEGIQTVAEVGRGEIVGEMALLTGMPRTATVTALTDVGILVGSPGEFRSIMWTSPTVAQRVYETYLARAADNVPAAA